MKKAYDVKELVNIAKDKGLEIAEDAAFFMLDAVAEWVEESAKISPTPYDNIVVSFLPTLKEEAAKAIDKIDGKEG